MGSNVIFELQPFFPLHKHLAGRSESRQFTYAAREASAAAQLALPAEGDTSGRGAVAVGARFLTPTASPVNLAEAEPERPDSRVISELTLQAV
jgi:hypothetical protein